MSILLYGLGAFCVIVGAALAWLGLPDREFSFGNTLILTGTVTMVGGLILVGLGAVVSRLQQLIEMGAGQAAAQPRRPAEAFEAATPLRPPAGRVPFPPKPKADTRPPVVVPAEMPPKVEPVAAFAPTLPNPDEPPMRVAEEVSLSPPQPMAEPSPEPILETEPAEGFDKEWPAPVSERRSMFSFNRAERRTEEPQAPSETPLSEAAEEPEVAAPPPPIEPAPEPAPTAPEPVSEVSRNVAILKSGVVDGMGYTLYVDGSIEAELPQGTLRFASINELRQHLEQNT